MNAQQVLETLTSLGIPSYVDSTNPTYAVHGDKPVSDHKIAFIVDTWKEDGPWDVILLGLTKYLGMANTQQELIDIVATI